jgi:hypothetical protein
MSVTRVVLLVASTVHDRVCLQEHRERKIFFKFCILPVHNAQIILGKELRMLHRTPCGRWVGRVHKVEASHLYCVVLGQRVTGMSVLLHLTC